MNRAFPTSPELIIQRLRQVLLDTHKDDDDWKGLEEQELGLMFEGLRALVQV